MIHPGGSACQLCGFYSPMQDLKVDSNLVPLATDHYQSTSSDAYSSNRLDSTSTSSPHGSMYSFHSFTDEPSWTYDHNRSRGISTQSPNLPQSQSLRIPNGIHQADHLSEFDTALSNGSSYQSCTRSQYSPRNQDQGFDVEQGSPAASPSHLAPTSMKHDKGDSKKSKATQLSQLYVSRPLHRARVRKVNAHKDRHRNRVACHHCSNTFSRQADVDRHVESVHNRERREMQGNLLDCPYENCHRKGNRGFGRKDHWLEHRRSFHHEDIPKRRSRSRSGKRLSGGSDDLPRYAS